MSHSSPLPSLPVNLIRNFGPLKTTVASAAGVESAGVARVSRRHSEARYINLSLHYLEQVIVAPVPPPFEAVCAD